jgi:glycine/D-amino acid oxidase-like deaminating enzyme
MQESIWFQTVSAEDRQLLGESDALPSTADYAVIGAGIIGLMTAYYLDAAGAGKIAVLDMGTAAGEASGANAGGLWFAQQSPELGPVAPLAAESSRLYQTLASEFDFDFERSGLIEILDADGDLAGAQRRAAEAQKLGFRVEQLSGSQAREIEPELGVTPAAAFLYRDDGHLNPIKLAVALVRHLRRRGVAFCFDTEVHAAGKAIETSRGTIDARQCAITTGAWTPLVTNALGYTPPIKPIRGTLLAVDPMPPTIRHTIVASEYYYWQLAEGHVAGGGTVDDVGFERGVEEAAVDGIRAELNTLFPAVAPKPTTRAWSGFRPYCEDLKPVIGPVPNQPGIFVAAGHFKKGIMLAPVTGKLMADLMKSGGTDLPIAPLDPARFA